MKRISNNDPLVSVTLPLAPNADPELLSTCLRSLSAQTFQGFEVLVLISDGSEPELHRIASAFPAVTILEGRYSKPAARNLLIQKSRGLYVLILDVDNELPHGLLEACVERATEDGATAIIAPNLEAPSTNFWRRCRSLEWKLLDGDLYAETPNFIRKDILEDLGGFDPELDLLDDWQLNLALRERSIPFERADSFILVRSSSSLREIWHRKFLRGQFIHLLQSKYANAPQIRFGHRFVRVYLRNWKLLINSPTLTVGLAILKALDVLALSWGRLNPSSGPIGDGTGAYFQSRVAKEYDQIRLGDNFSRYKHYSEIRSLTILLQELSDLLLEVGSGTGRVTDGLVKNGFRILPLDPSSAMVRQYVQKPSLPRPIIADGTALPFSNSSFDGVFSLRVIWHLPSMNHVERMLGELTRVSSNLVVVDITNRQRWRHALLRPFIAIYFRMRPSERSAHESSRLLALNSFEKLSEPLGLRLERIRPLDVLSPIWLRLLPKRAALTLYPILFRLESVFWKVIPPGRLLIKLTKRSGSI
ncbi:MAG: glycosyltransferase [Anaerolineales bacterium]